MVPISYEKPIGNFQRPYGSYRFDVFSLKAGRRMTLFGKAALGQFIELEADHEVSAICERPLKIPNLRPERAADFWAICGGKPTFFLLVSGDGLGETGKKKAVMDEFRTWVKAQGALLTEIDVAGFHERRTFHSNWATILQHLIAHRGQVVPALLERCALVMQPRFTLAQFESQLFDVDAMLARAAVFHLLASGRIRCRSLATEPLHPGTILERP